MLRYLYVARLPEARRGDRKSEAKRDGAEGTKKPSRLGDHSGKSKPQEIGETKKLDGVLCDASVGNSYASLSRTACDGR